MSPNEATILHDRSNDDAIVAVMKRAITLARKGEGRVEPNPMVGCVIARNGRVIGEGYHRRFGGPHAEVEALRACTEDPAGATAYVTLEPCCHVGKTPPCTDALIDARVDRVVMAMGDPSKQVAGGGVRKLRRAGITVTAGVCRDEASELLQPFLTRTVLARPYVIAKWAQSLDGKLATRTGDSRWISCESSRRRVHRLRARVDAILVGVGTVLVDDSQLTARNVRIRRRARRIVLDTRLRIPLRCQLVDTAQIAPTLVVTTSVLAGSRKAKRLSQRGVEVITCPTKANRLSLNTLLRKLAQRDVTNLLVEGGPAVQTSFLDAGLVDEAHVYVAPVLIGGHEAPTAFGGRGAARVDAALKPRKVITQRSGVDTFHRLLLTEPPTI